MKQAMFFDIDGTLYYNKFHQIDDHILEEFDELRKEGIDLYLLSSRSPHEIVHLPGEFLNYPYSGLILEGGAAVYDQNQNLVDAWLIPGDDIKKIKDYCKDNNLIWRYSGPDGNYFDTEPDPYVRFHWRRLYMICPRVKKWKGDDVCNVIVWTNDPKKQEEITRLLPEDSLVRYSDCMEIRAKGVSKEHIVERFRDHYGYRKVTCVGDGMNDLEMIRQADVGVAVRNAHREVKEAADLVIGPVSENGVSEWLRSRRGR